MRRKKVSLTPLTLQQELHYILYLVYHRDVSRAFLELFKTLLSFNNLSHSLSLQSFFSIQVRSMTHLFILATHLPVARAQGSTPSNS